MWGMICGALVFVLAYSSPALSGCLSRVEPVADEDIAYRDRGGRCEGVYRTPVAGSIDLRLIGFQNAYEGAIPAGRWPVQVVGYDQPRATLRAVSTRPGLHYVMDTQALNKNGRFDWPTEVLSHLGLKGRDLAIVACSNECSEISENTLVWPVILGNSPSKPGTALQVVLEASVELTEVFITASDGSRKILDEEPLGAGYFPPDRPITIPIRSLPPGRIRFEVSVVSRAGRAGHLVTTLVVPRFAPAP